MLRLTNSLEGNFLLKIVEIWIFPNQVRISHKPYKMFSSNLLLKHTLEIPSYAIGVYPYISYTNIWHFSVLTKMFIHKGSKGNQRRLKQLPNSLLFKYPGRFFPVFVISSNFSVSFLDLFGFIWYKRFFFMFLYFTQVACQF